MSPPPSPSPDPVIVSTASKLAELIEEAVVRGVRRVLDEARPEVESHEWLSLRQAERAYDLSRSTLWRKRRAGLIEEKEIAGRIYLRPPS